MNLPAGWKFGLDIYPPDWRFPAGNTWIAGWIRPDAGNTVTDIRAWLGQRAFLGLHGLPHSGSERESPSRNGLPYLGFSFLLQPAHNATGLRLEACDLSGHWADFFHTPIEVAPGTLPSPTPAGLAEALPALLPPLVRRAAREPERSLAELADETIAAVIAEPLNTKPNPPFTGALEEPTLTGRVEHGRLAVTGWLTHRTAKITRLTAMVDPLREVSLQRAATRADIVASFPELARHENPAFLGQVELPSGMNLPVLLKIFAELDTGEKHLVFAQRFTPRIKAGAGQTQPTVTGLKFARCVWALRSAAKRHGLPYTGVTGAGRKAWADYPAKPTAIRTRSLPTQNRGRPLRLVVVTHNLNFEGAPRLILELSTFFLRQPGVHIQVVSPADGPLRALFESAGMKVTVVDLASALKATTPADFHAQLESVGRSFDWSGTDVVLANTMVSFWAVHLAHRAGKPAVLYVHESSPVPNFFAAIVAPALFPVIEEAFTLAQRVSFTADASRQIFARLDRRNAFRVLPSWLDVADIDQYRSQHDRNALRVKHGFPADAVLLLNLGTVCERKGQHVFVRAATLLESELRQTYPARNIEFIMVGARDDDFLCSLRAQVAEARLQHVRFVPETRENYAFHHMADLLVCTSFEESSPRVLLEAAAFGTPIVSSDVFGIPELLTGRESWLVEPGDHYRLANALRRALAAYFAGDTTRSERARASVAARFDENVSLPRHLALVREAAGLSAEDSTS